MVRFSEKFPSQHDPSKREQGVKDLRVLAVTNQNKYLLFTSDKEMREAHADEIRKTEVAIICSAKNQGVNVTEIYAEAFLKSKARILRDFSKLKRPYFCVLHSTGKVEMRTIPSWH